MAERVALGAKPRSVLGKRVRHIRREGRLPANVFGKDVDSVAVELDAREFRRTIKSHGSRHLFDLSIEGEAKSRPVVIRALSRSGGTGELIHVDFYQVDTRRPISTTVAIQLTGEAPAVKDLAGTLVHTLETVSVRCLPLAIPDNVQGNLGKLVSFDVSLTVGDLVAPEGVEILTEASIPVATVVAPRLRLEGEAEEAPAAEAAETEAPEEEESAEE
jgi:large subunit ribosomal protein L25